MADVVLAIHFGFVLFVVVGMAAIVVGGFSHWGWVRNCAFRIMHFAAIAYVAIESLLGIDCPLTVWENALRGETRRDFIPYWLHRLMFYDLPPHLFTAAYLIFAIAVAATFFWVPPKCMRRNPTDR